MIYDGIREGTFRSRPNRFVAIAEIDGREVRAHVKNTGRCREILVPGTRAVFQGSDAPGRRTGYDLIAAYKGDTLINIDSQAPNRVFREFLGSSGMVPDILEVRQEYTLGDSRFDFLIRTPERRILAEVKGVTLERDGMTLFPDAPTERGVRHVRGLMRSIGQGYEAMLVFVVQMKGVRGFAPNREMHPEFHDAVREAMDSGVEVHAFDCITEPDRLEIDAPVEVML